MKENKLNSVHLDGFLEGLQYESQSSDGAVAWASVVTLHPKSAADGGRNLSDQFSYLHHDVRLTASDRDGVEALRKVWDGYSEVKGTSALYPCSLSGMLVVEGNDSFVSCDAGNLLRTDSVKTNDNNIVNIEGNLVSVAIRRFHAALDIELKEGVLKALVYMKENPAVWEKLSRGEFRKGDVLYLNGPLLSQRMTDGQTTLKMCAVSPHLVQKRQLDKKIRKKGSQTV